MPLGRRLSVVVPYVKLACVSSLLVLMTETL